MKQIFVESNKTYHHGFVIKEQDLRRIIDLIIDQFKKISSNRVEFKYILKFKNGAIANTPDLEDVLKQENEGSSSIVRLQISAKLENTGDDDTIRINFRNTDIEYDFGENPIAHSIKGQSRDWVFVTSSLIEERITKIRRRSLDHLFSKGPGKLFFRLLTTILTFGLMIAFLALTPGASSKAADKQLKLLNQIEKNWKGKVITDPIDAIIQIEKAKTEKDYRLDTSTLFLDIIFTKPIIIIFSILIALMTLTFVFSKVYPVYNFLWGSYLEIFSKKESMRRLIVGIIVGTIVLGIIVNLLSNYIWEEL